MKLIITQLIIGDSTTFIFVSLFVYHIAYIAKLIYNSSEWCSVHGLSNSSAWVGETSSIFGKLNIS